MDASIAAGHRSPGRQDRPRLVGRCSCGRCAPPLPSLARLGMWVLVRGAGARPRLCGTRAPSRIRSVRGSMCLRLEARLRSITCDTIKSAPMAATVWLGGGHPSSTAVGGPARVTRSRRATSGAAISVRAEVDSSALSHLFLRSSCASWTAVMVSQATIARRTMSRSSPTAGTS
jgi:hypothetical protein